MIKHLAGFAHEEDALVFTIRKSRRPSHAGLPKNWVCHGFSLCYCVRMSAIEMVLEKVKHLDEAHARQLLTWLQRQESAAIPARHPAGAIAMLGFARRLRSTPRATADWMNELRAGERE